MSQVKFGTIQWDALVQVGPVVLTTDVSGVLPVPNGGNGTGSYTNGQILIGNTTGNTLTKASLTGTTSQVIVTPGSGSITLSLPQNIATTSTPQFARMGVGVAASAAANAMLCVGGNPTTFTSANYVAVVDATNGGAIVLSKDSTNYSTIQYSAASSAFTFTTVEAGSPFQNTIGCKAGNVIVGGLVASSGATRNLILSGGATSPVPGAATADLVNICGFDRINTRHAAAGNRLLAIQGERGSPIYVGDDAIDFAATTAIVSVNAVDILSLTSTAIAAAVPVTKYNNIATVSGGIPAEYATIDLTGQTANIGATTLYAVPSTGAGMYRVSAYVVLTTAASVSSTLPNVQIVFTDNQTSGSITMNATPILGVAGIGQTGALTANTVGTAVSGVIVVNAKASTNIQYSLVNYASSLAGMAYAVHLKLEAM